MPNLQPSDRDIPSLDGLRAISVLMVIGMHELQRLVPSPRIGIGSFVLFNGDLGVRIFFAISGYLITRLLLREFDQKGSISLKRFYLRRAFRILPALYVYIAVLGILGALGRLPVTAGEMLRAATFVSNYSNLPQIWALEHTWSLCVEEQFYLLWPPLLLWALLHWKGKQGAVHAARAGLIAVVVIYFTRIFFRIHFVPYLSLGAAFHNKADTILMGCVAALMEGYAPAERVYAAVMRFPLLALALVYPVSGYLTLRYHNNWAYLGGNTLDALLLSCILVWCVREPSTLFGRFLNLPAVRWLGTLSYSIYLWQTFFIHHDNVPVFGGERFANTLPGNLLFILLAGVASFYLVEQPMLRVRNRLFRRQSPV